MKGLLGWTVAAGALAGSLVVEPTVRRPPAPAAESTGESAGPTGNGDPGTPGQDMGNLDYDGGFTFVRIRFNGGGLGRGRFGRGGGEPWAHDFPYADNNFVKILDEVTYVRPHVDGTNVISADSPLLHRYPVAYLVEPGRWSPTQEEVDNLGAYLKKGGFLILDDFRGEREWRWLEEIMTHVLPDHRFRQLTIEEPIFKTFFEIESLDFQPPTFQQYTPYFMGIHQDNDPEKRLLIIANFNNDIGDYWEYSDMGYFPIDLSNEAYKVGVNYVIYGMTR